jgi:hypothetical protein
MRLGSGGSRVCEKANQKHSHRNWEAHSIDGKLRKADLGNADHRGA